MFYLGVLQGIVWGFISFITIIALTILILVTYFVRCAFKELHYDYSNLSSELRNLKSNSKNNQSEKSNLEIWAEVKHYKLIRFLFRNNIKVQLYGEMHNIFIMTKKFDKLYLASQKTLDEQVKTLANNELDNLQIIIAEKINEVLQKVDDLEYQENNKKVLNLISDSKNSFKNKNKN